MKNQKNLLRLLNIVVVVYVIANVIIGLEGTNATVVMPFLIIPLGMFVFTHGTIRYGIKNILILIGIGMAVSLFYEAMSIATGFPYSGFHYTEIFGPKLFGFPLIVMVGYGVSIYTFWTVTGSLIGNYNNKLRGANIVLVPILAAFLFTSWDYALDPIMASINGAYIWDNHGSYFGIPFSNYLGWYLCTYSIYQFFALVVYRKTKLDVPTIMKRKTFWYQAIAMYVSIFIQLPILMKFEGNEQLTIFSGQVLQTNDIYQSMTLVGIAAIIFPAFIAFVNVFNTKELE